MAKNRKNRQQTQKNVTEARQQKEATQQKFLDRFRKTNDVLPPEAEQPPLSEAVLQIPESQQKAAEQGMAEIEQLSLSLRQMLAKQQELKHNYDELCNQAETQRLMNDQQSRELEQQEQTLAQEARRLEQRQKDQETRLQREFDTLESRTAGLNERSVQLQRLQAEVDNDFASQREVFALELADLRKEQYAVLEVERQQLQDERKALLAPLHDKKRALTEQQRVLDAERELFEQQQDEFQKRQQNLEAWKTAQREQIEQALCRQIAEQDFRLSDLQEYRRQDQQRICELQQRLQQFAEIERQMEEEGVDNLRVALAELRQKNHELRQHLREPDEDDLQQRLDDLETENEQWREKVQDQQQEINQLNHELSTARLGVAEQHKLRKENRVLELHKNTLDSSIDALEQTLDELTARQQGREPFPALSAMDKKYSELAFDLQPVPTLAEFAQQIRNGLTCVYDSNPLYYSERAIRLFIAGLAMSELHIFQGMSGTGKTSLAKAFAKVVGGHCTDIAVQSGWRDKDDLLGHYNAFEKKFYEKEALQALYRAQLPEYEDRLNIILLDEMNLSRPEQYFAEFLSAMEKSAAEDRKVVLVESSQQNAPARFEEGRTLKLPENIWFIGTANHDETTNEFADKTYDRAHVMELERHAEHFEAPQYSPTEYSYQSLKKAFTKAARKHREAVTEILKALSDSTLHLMLEETFAVSWGNRLERHAYRFLPVVIEVGGSMAEGLDHLLATKVFRAGKATGRYDVQESDLNELKDTLLEFWKDQGLAGKPQQSLQLIDRDIRRLGNGG